jgi:protein O-GlcNAc transferase
MNFLQRILKSLGSKSSETTLDAQWPEALKLIEQGQMAERTGALDEALRQYEQAVAIAPRYPKAHMNLGNAHLAMRNVERAHRHYTTAIELDPTSAPAHYNLGNAYWHKGENDNALRYYLKATDLDPKFVLPWTAIANTLVGMNNHKDAIEACNHALKIDNSVAEAHVVLAMIQHDLGQIDESIDSMTEAMRLDPFHKTANNNLSNYLEHAFRFKEAQNYSRQAIAQDPQSVSAKTRLLYLLSQDPDTSPVQLFREHVQLGESIEKSQIGYRTPHINRRDPDRRIRVGFISPDLRNHALAHFVEPIFRIIRDSRDVEIIAYYNYAEEDDGTTKFQTYFKHWRKIVNLADDQLDRLIRQDEIDVLIDLAGHTANNRLSLFARKPAPVQASWIGYPGTTGIKAIDYYIADKFFLPETTFATQFSEKLVYLPSTAPYTPFSLAPSIESLPALRNGFFTFGSFNRPSKIHRNVIRLWSKVLFSTPRSRLMMSGISDQYQLGILKSWLLAEGLSEDRLDLRLRCTVEPYLKQHHDVDLCLDTYPYTGGTTTRHALWMGVPTITIAGQTPASRQASSILELVDLHQFIASSQSTYVDISTFWINRMSELSDIRMNMRERIAGSPLGQDKLVTDAFVRATRIMWQRWCANEAPSLIDVSEPEMIRTQT